MTVSGSAARVWDAATGRPDDPDPVHDAYALDRMDLSPDGRLLVTAGEVHSSPGEDPGGRIGSASGTWKPGNWPSTP